jgi:serine protease Do
VTALGLTLSNITAELKDKFSLKDDKGVVVLDVAGGSPASKKGLEPGDVILEASQQEIKNPGQIAAKIDEAKRAGRSSILVLVDRQGELRFFALRLDQG